MSEEILRALMQLFAIIAKQDDGVSSVKNDYVREFLSTQINSELVAEYYALYQASLEDGAMEGDKKRKAPAEQQEGRARRTSVTDSARIMKFCKKINKTLQQQQKVIVYVRLLEFIKSDNSFTPLREEIIETVARVFRMPKEEIGSIERFTKMEHVAEADLDKDILVIGDLPDLEGASHLYIRNTSIHGAISVLRVPSANLFFLRYDSRTTMHLNNKPVQANRVYLFPPGGVLRPGHSRSIYYSDINAAFLSDQMDLSLDFMAEGISHTFRNGHVGLHPLSIHETNGRLIGIMGASGAGKTTLLNLLSGQQAPTTGNITINGMDLYRDRKQLEGAIGLVPQDDLLFEDLTVFENLFYNARLSFRNLSREALVEKVETVLYSLGLIDIKDLKVGSPLAKVISGGQRKRLNIALELIREPAVLFMDEPTSGLSSRDSENVMDLLRELALKGKLIFVVIHQPSSTIFKLFDNLFVLDTGGYLIYEGNPVAAVTYFKQQDHQLHHGEGECEVCGNVNPESIFDIIESKVVDEYGNTTDKRKVLPKEWYAVFQQAPAEAANPPAAAPEAEAHRPLPKASRPGKLRQWLVFTIRDLKTKLNNRQYLIITLAEAPALAFFLSVILRYTSFDREAYAFSFNKNIPAYIFVSIIIATFLGLMVSSEEIIKDRKILKREQFLNLSRFSYLLSKVGILFGISAIQSLLFVLIGHNVLEYGGQFLPFWFTLFSVSALANLVGLNISASFNSVVTIYILIPLLIIPQLVLSGAMFSFDRINPTVGGGNNVPVIAHAMPAKWAYEGLMVHQFKHNPYNALFFELDRDISYYDFRIAYTLPELKKALAQLLAMVEVNREERTDSLQRAIDDGKEFVLRLVTNEANNMPALYDGLTREFFNKETIHSLRNNDRVATMQAALEELEQRHRDLFNAAFNRKEQVLAALQEDPEKAALLQAYKQQFTNEAVSDLVTNQAALVHAFEVQDNQFVQLSDPVYQRGMFTTTNGWDAPFYSGFKGVLGHSMDTFWFNLLVIWTMGVLLFLALWFRLLKKLLQLPLTLNSNHAS